MRRGDGTIEVAVSARPVWAILVVGGRDHSMTLTLLRHWMSRLNKAEEKGVQLKGVALVRIYREQVEKAFWTGTFHSEIDGSRLAMSLLMPLKSPPK